MMKFDKHVYWCKLAAFCCLFVVLLSEVESEELQCTRKHILNTIELDGLFSMPNTYRLYSEGQNLTESDCIVWDRGEGEGAHDCSDLQFPSSTQGAVAGVEFYPYLNPDLNLNVSFRNIKWHYMQYRVQVGERKMCHKLQFSTSVTPLDTLRLSFACIFDWWAADSAEVHMNVGDSSSGISRYSHFVMKIPRNKQHVDSSSKSLPIKDWYISVAVDISQKLYLLVYWPVVPDHYNVTEYKVQINKDEPRHVKLSSCENGYCSLRMFAGYSSRNITVSVQPVHEECQKSCYSLSPVISVEFYLPVSFIVLMVLVPILTSVIIICSIYYRCCIVPSVSPKVLLLHDPTTKYHDRVARILAEYLKEVCGVLCLRAYVEVPLTESMNASKWLHKTIDEVDAVLYVASPPPEMDIRYTEYPNLVYEALELIQNRRNCRVHQRAGYYLVAEPPYCKGYIPKPLMDVPRFRIPDELSWLLWTLFNQKCWVPPFTCMAKIYLKFLWCPGPMSAYRLHGTRLKKAMEIACAKKMWDDGLPFTPQSSRRSWGTLPEEPNPSEDSMLYEPHPGQLDKVLHQEEISVVSEDDVASRQPPAHIILDGLDLGPRDNE